MSCEKIIRPAWTMFSMHAFGYNDWKCLVHNEEVNTPLEQGLQINVDFSRTFSFIEILKLLFNRNVEGYICITTKLVIDDEKDTAPNSNTATSSSETKSRKRTTRKKSTSDTEQCSGV